MTPIRYHYPLFASQHPLELSKERFFLEASGLSYATDNLEAFREPYHNEWIKTNIPMGYKAILVLERLVFVRNGEILLENEPTEDARIQANFNRPERSRYCVYSNRPISFPKYKASLNQMSRNEGWAYSDITWNSLADAKSSALEASQSPDLDLLIVTRVLCFENWH